MRPMVSIGELVPGRSPRLHLGAHVLRHARAGSEEIDEAADVILVLLPDLRPGGVIGVRVGVVRPNEISGEAAVIVDVGFAVWHPDRVPERLELWLVAGGDQRFEVARKQLVFGRSIFRGLLLGQAVGWVLRIAKAEVIGLDTSVTFAWRAAIARLNKRQQPAGRLARLEKRI